MAYTQTYFDLLDRLGRLGCPVCGLLLRDEQRSIESLLYEYVGDEGVHEAFRRGRGLCNHHSWLLAHQHGYSLGVSQLFETALDEVIHILKEDEAAAPSPGLESALSGWLGGKRDTPLADKLAPEAPCMICANLREAECRYTKTFATYWREDAVQKTYPRSDGLCLPHLRDVLRHMQRPACRQQLAEIHCAKWTALKGELDQFQIKSAFNYVGEPMGAEADSWRRAVASLAGNEGIVGSPAHPR